MAIQGSGAISMTDIVDEFGGSVPHSLSEYYRNGGAVPGNNTNVPTSGTISLSNFYNAVNEIQLTISSTTTNYQLSSAFGSNWSTAVPKRLTINNGVTVGSSTTTAAMTIEGSMGGTLVVQNSGSIIGKGGAGSSSGSGGPGYTAVKCDQNGNITFQNNSNGAIYGGGGGGGRGGNGGTGGTGGQGGTGGNGSYATGSIVFATHFRGDSFLPWVANHCGSNSISQPSGLSHLGEAYGCRYCKGTHYFAQGGKYNQQSRSVKGKSRFQFNQNCAYNATQGGAAGGSGGSGGAGGAGGAGGNGRGYNQSQQNGSSGSAGAGGNSGSGGGNNGNGSGTGGTGGTGGQGGTGGTGGNGGGYGTSGSSGNTGATGNTGASGSSGSNGNAGSGGGGSSGSGGSSGAGGSSGGAAGYYIQNRHYMTFQNSGSVAGQ